MIELVVFDMAGTTVDEGNVVYKTVRESVNAAGYEFSQEQVQAVAAGKEKLQAIRDVLALDGEVHSEEEAASIFEDFKRRLTTAYQQLDVREQPDASLVFRQLRSKGIKSVLNTGYDRTTAESLIDKLGWVVGREIDGLVTASDVANNRPHPDMIHRAIALVGCSSSLAVVKVGDSQIDIEEGKNAGCAMTFGITTGAQSESQLREAQPTAVLHALPELIDALTSQGTQLASREPTTV
ncbi:phosphonatase-like hydrolase [Aeoliella sp. SH292]|uniref:phosphonatase-like hydrolase n=1 Tax=Aeoliella sp. SH292 TaxID=3454464 RepID=UPI003F9DF3E0